jgi:hypothetical protein
MDDSAGVCAFGCPMNGNDSDCPGASSACITILPDRASCLKKCSSKADCGSLECKSFANKAGTFCMPAAWASRMLPF